MILAPETGGEQPVILEVKPRGRVAIVAESVSGQRRTKPLSFKAEVGF